MSEKITSSESSKKSSKTSKKPSSNVWDFLISPSGQKAVSLGIDAVRNWTGIDISKALGIDVPPIPKPSDAQETIRKWRDSTSGPSPYKILGVDSDAPQGVVRAAYKALCKQYHPDSGKEPNVEKTKEINIAYEQICNMKGWTK